MTNEEIQALKEELKQEIIEEMRQKQQNIEDVAKPFQRKVTEYCQSLECDNIDRDKIKNFIYTGIRIHFNLNGISHLTKENVEKAYEIFEQLKHIVDTRKKITKVVVTGNLDCSV